MFGVPKGFLCQNSKRVVGSQKTEVSVPAKPRLHVKNFSRKNCFSPKFGQNSQKDFVFFTRVPIDFNGEKKISHFFFLVLVFEGKKKNVGVLIFILALCINSF
jgi:hypothetical protein